MPLADATTPAATDQAPRPAAGPDVLAGGKGDHPQGELLRVEGLTKAFPGLVANDRIDLDLRAGEIHAVVGENGAGKTTLMGLLYGLHQPDAGDIRIGGKPVHLGSPRGAITAGIAFVQQHYSLVPTLSVLDNIMLSRRYGAGALETRRQVAERLRELATRYGFRLRPDEKVENLSVGEQQRIELVKALMAEPKVLILDEPAALLPAQEVAQLWTLLRQLAGDGVGILLIGHNLEDVLAVADRVTVLRRGKKIGTVAARDATPASIGLMMVGTLTESEKPPLAQAIGGPVMEVSALTAAGERRARAVDGASFTLNAGEILGIAGVEDSGQEELLECLAGVRPVSGGSIRLNGADLGSLSARQRQAAGLAYVPADRHRDGLIGPMSVADNLALTATGHGLARFGILRGAAIRERATRLASRFGIRAASPAVPAATLSGGNQQKLILARELSRDPKVVLCAYPTRGLDFASTGAVHAELREAAARGAAVLVVSADLNELLGLSHRLLVMQGGRIVGEMPAAEASAERIGLMLGGGHA